MKNSTFILWQAVLGIIVGLCLWAILAGISLDYSFLLRAYFPNAAVDPHSIIFSQSFNFLSNISWLFGPLAWVFSFIAVFLLVRQLEPTRTSILDRVLVSLAVVAVTYLCSTNGLLDFKTIDWANFVCVISASGLGWLAVYHRLWIGKRSADSSRRFTLIKILAFGALYGLFLVFLFVLIAHIYNFFFTVSWTVWEDGWSARRMTVLMVSCLVPCVVSAIGFGFAPVLAANEVGLSERLKRAIAPLILLLIVSCVFGGVHYKAVHEYDWGKTFEQATGIPDTQIPPSKTLINLTFDKIPKVELQDWPMMTVPDALFLEKVTVAATPANLEALKKFALDPSHNKSHYWRVALEAIPELDGCLWDPRGLVEFYADISRSPSAFRLSSSLYNIRPLAWIKNNSPIDDFGRQKLEILSDPGLFNIKTYTIRMVSRAWDRFGDLPKAEYWKEKFLASDANDKEKKEFMLKKIGLLTKGVITGKIELRGVVMKEPLIVGLFREEKSTKSLGAPGREDGYFHSTNVFYRIVDSKTAQKDGTFQFENLSDGSYSIVVMVPSSALPADTKGLTVKRHPGILTLSKKKPVIKTGVITLLLPKR